MRPDAPRHRPASIHRRLLNGARERGEDPQFAVQRYAAERFLYRLGVSSHRDAFVLKGAMLFAIWGGSAYRPTRDLDFTGYGDPDDAAVRHRIRDVCQVEVPDDGMTFAVETLRSEPIRDATEYGGLRIAFEAWLGEVRVRMQLDVGFGNAIEPGAVEADYPVLLDAPAPRIRAYPPEAVVAEKLHAMVLLAERNSRMKDFYDVYVLATRFAFDGERLARRSRPRSGAATRRSAATRPSLCRRPSTRPPIAPGSGRRTCGATLCPERRRTSTSLETCWSASSLPPGPRLQPRSRFPTGGPRRVPGHPLSWRPSDDRPGSDRAGIADPRWPAAALVAASQGFARG